MGRQSKKDSLGAQHPLHKGTTYGRVLSLSNVHITFRAPTVLHVKLIQKGNLASYAMGTGFLSGVKRPGLGVDHPPPSSAEVKERVGLYLYSPSGPSWHVIG